MSMKYLLILVLVALVLSAQYIESTPLASGTGMLGKIVAKRAADPRPCDSDMLVDHNDKDEPA